MVSIIFILFFGLISENQVADSLEMRRVEGDGFVDLIFINKNIYPVTIELNLETSNLSSGRRSPVSDVIKGRSQKNVIRLNIEDLRKPYSIETKYIWYKGNIFAQHDDKVLYKFPYRRGTSYRLDQGYNGSFSHTGDNSYSLDFFMPEGSHIHAAREGIVIDVIQDNRGGGIEERYKQLANNITILHEDGTMADYSHLKYMGAKVQVGQRIRAGQFIGYSGSTGFVTGPHLHFKVKKAKIGGGFTSIPIRFTSQKGIVDMLQVGQEYLAY